MKHKLLFTCAIFCLIFTFAAFASDTVYVDGVGTDENCYATLAQAVSAVDEGGTVILTADYATPTGAATTLSKGVTITSNGTAVLTVGRALILGGDTVFENITVKNGGAVNLDFIYCHGYNLVIGENVTTAQSSNGRYLSIFAGDPAASCALSNTITVKSGVWRGIYTGGNTPAAHCSGTCTVNIYDGASLSGNQLTLGGLQSGATVDVYVTVNIYGGTVSGVTKGNAPATSYNVTIYGGTVSSISVPVTVDLTNGGKATILSENGNTVTTVTRDGYTVDHTDTVYSVPFVCLDGTGETVNAYTDIKSAVSALTDGGTVILTGDTTVGTASAGVTLPAIGGKVTITSENGEKFIFARSLTLSSEIEFTNINFHSTATASGNILCCGNKLTIGDGVTVTVSSGGWWPAIFGGTTSNVSYDSHLVIKSGEWRTVYGGNFSNTFSGNSTVEVSNMVSRGTISAENYSGTFSGTSELIIDLRGNKTVTASTYVGTPTFLVDDGYEAVLTDNTYSQQEIPEESAPTVVYLNSTGDDGAYTALEDAVAAVADGGTVILTEDITTSSEILYLPEKNFTLTSENEAVLTIGRTIYLGGNTRLENIAIKNGRSGGSGQCFIYCNGYDFTVESDVTTVATTALMRIYGGHASDAVTADNTLTLKGGKWARVYIGNLAGTFAGKTSVIIDGASISLNVQIGNESSGTFSADCDVTVKSGTVGSIAVSTSAATCTYTVTLNGGSVSTLSADATVDLEVDGSVTIGSATGTVTTKAPDGYEVVLNGTTYTVQEIPEEPAPTLVYLDGTGATDGAYTDLASAVAALTDGGTVVVTGDTTVGTSSAGVTLSAVGGKITITSKEGDTNYGATLTIARAITLSSEIEFNNIGLCGAHSTLSNIIARGNTITMGEGVTTSTTAGRYPSIYGGAASGTVSYDSHIIVKSGYFRNVFGGNAGGTFGGNSYVEIYGATVHNLLYGGNENQSSTFSGTSTLKMYSGATGGTVKADNIEINLTDLGTVAATVSFTGTVTTVVPDGYELLVSGTTYTVQEISEEAAPTLVYLDGTGATDGAYTDLESAALALRKGGTVVVCGDTRVDSAIALFAGGDLLITSVYDGVDYTDSAALLIANDITLGAPTTFKDIVLDKAATGDDYIFANGNALTIDEGVFCRNILATRYITLVGGAKSGTFEGDSCVTVKSGFFRNIFGGNYSGGTFKGTSTVNFLGGYVDNIVAGGNFLGNFEGTATVNIGGDAVLPYSSGVGVNGGTVGSTSTQYTFVGDIYINIYDNARISRNVYGTTRYSNITTTGNVYITVKDDAFLFLSLYAGGYEGTLNGNTSVIVDNGWVGSYLLAGSHSGTVNGDTYLEINGGQINYYGTNGSSSASTLAGEYDVAGGGYTGAVNGNTVVNINGGDIYGNVYGGSNSTGTVSGTSAVTVTNAEVMCGIYADGATEGSVSGDKSLTVDLSKGGTLAVGLPMSVNTLIGGGKLILFPEATVTADTFSGDITLEINGVPLASTYIEAAETTDASVTYIAQDSEQFVSEDGNYGVSSEGYYATTKVTFKHYSGAYIEPIYGKDRNGTVIEADEEYDTYSVFNLAPGFYNCRVCHSSSDRKRVYFYITGKEEEITFDYSNFTPTPGDAIDLLNILENSPIVAEEFYNNGDLVGFETPDSPFFNEDRAGTRLFTTNEEMLEFVDAKVSTCDYAYSYDLFTTMGGTTIPVVVFTKDEIPVDATLEETAKIVTAEEGRDIILIGAYIHGNEPSAGEGALAMISEMCGNYGEEFLTGNVGAVIIIPRINPDGSATFTRSNYNGLTLPSGLKVENLNRGYALLSGPETTGVAYAFKLFAPTVHIDLHEAGLVPYFGESNTLTDVYDVAFMCAGLINSPFADSEAVIKGDYDNRGMFLMDTIEEMREDVEAIGLRTYYYQPSFPSITNATPWGQANGALSILLEIPGINGGDFLFERRVFTHVASVKAILDYTKASDGELAKEVLEAREKLALSAQKFDVNTPIVLQTQYTRHDSTTKYANNMLVALDATVRKAENPTKFFTQDIAMKYRARPTAYVLSKDTDKVDRVLSILDGYGIDYYELEEGVTLNLKHYTGSSSSAVLGEANDVTFDSGAYIIPVDGYKAYVIALIFEPENFDADSQGPVTFVQGVYLAASDIYRSEESYIAAKLGLGGTYVEIDTEGKTVASAEINGVAYDDVDTIGEKAYVVNSADSATVTFTDGTSQVYYLRDVIGDTDNDRTVTLADAISIIRAVLNGENLSNCDVNGDGKVNIRDAIQVIKILINE